MAASGEARASAGCDDVNAGAYNVTNLNANIIGTVQNFSVGDQITFVVNDDGSSAQFQLYGTSQLLNLQISATPQTVPYTVTGANGDTTSIQAYFSPNNPNATVTATATCGGAQPTPGPSGKDASQTVTKGFLLSRINGLLLNDPGSTSLLNRSTGQAGPTTAALGNATNVASSGNGFGGAMGLGAGLGNRSPIATDRLGFGASHFDGADADTAGPQTIQFSNSLSKMRREAAQAQMNKERMGARCWRRWRAAAGLRDDFAVGHLGGGPLLGLRR